MGRYRVKLPFDLDEWSPGGERYFESFGFQRQLPQEPGRHVKQGGPDPGMCYEENATGHYCTLTGQGELAIAAGEGHCVPYSVLPGSEPFSPGKGIRPHAFFDA